jgi:hypothetical protein
MRKTVVAVAVASVLLSGCGMPAATTTIPSDAAFLTDLHAAQHWQWNFNPADAVTEAHKVCAIHSPAALSDVLKMVNREDPRYVNADNSRPPSVDHIEEVTEFAGLAAQHFCPK